MLPYWFAYIVIPICLLYHIVLPILSSQLVYVYQLAYMLTTLSPFPNIGYNIVVISLNHKTNPLIMGPYY
jgi:hypothetical protein